MSVILNTYQKCLDSKHFLAKHLNKCLGFKHLIEKCLGSKHLSKHYFEKCLGFKHFLPKHYISV